MKLKASKEEKPTGKSMMLLKKPKSAIEKVKKGKAGTLKKPSAAKVSAKLLKNATKNQLLQHVKREDDTKPKKKTEPERLPPLVKQVKKEKLKKKEKKPLKEEDEEEKKEDTPEDAAKKARTEERKKAMALQKKQQEEGGEVVRKATRDTLALVPEQLISARSFGLVYRVVDSKSQGKGNQLFGDDLKFMLEITAEKVGLVPSRNARVTLPHSLIREDDEIALIVSDSVRGRKHDYQGTANEWEDRLKDMSLERKVTVIPFQKLKSDYNTFETQRKLMRRFDLFVCDARIVGHVFAFAGSTFIRKRLNATPVRLDGTDSQIEAEIKRAIRTVTFKRGSSGLVTSIKFAARWMPEELVVENGMAVLEMLKTIHPGGWLNVQQINLSAMGGHSSYSLPFYVSTIDPNLVPVPVEVGPRQKFVKKQQKLFSEQTGGRFTVGKDGVVRTVKADGEPESDVEMALEDLEPEDDDNWVPYDDEPPARMRTGGRPRQRGPKMRIK